MADAVARQQLADAAPLLAETWQVMGQCLQSAGLAPLPVFGKPPASVELRPDSLDHSFALCAGWRAADGTYQGVLVLNGNGKSFSEFDVLLPHPRKPGWFIEAVTAWGELGRLKAELRLLPGLME